MFRWLWPTSKRKETPQDRQSPTKRMIDKMDERQRREIERRLNFIRTEMAVMKRGRE